MSRLKYLISSLVERDVFSQSEMLTYLDEAILLKLQVIDVLTFKQRRVKAITQHHFEQQKFNLLREENEGFAKLIVELGQSNMNMANVEIVKSNVKELIGFFSLDPNRVLDVIIDSFCNHVWNIEPYVALL
jgi:hypothetical protein